MIRRFFMLCTLIMCVALGSYAQNISIKGRLISGENIVDYASVVLRNADSVYVSGVMSDKKGFFLFDNIKPANYIIVISCMGYSDKYLTVDAKDNTDLGDVVMNAVAKQLNEVVVKAAKVIRTDEGQVALPSKFQIEASSNGVDLLRSMQLSRLTIDPIKNTIKTSTPGEVQLRINGAKADVYQVRALRPENIQRIEYHDDPGMKYGQGVACVLDYITKRPIRGGQVSIDGWGSPFDGFDQGEAQGSVNKGNSQFGGYFWGFYRDLHSWRENSETFNNADGITFTRMEDGKSSPLKMKNSYANLYYNYKKGDDLYFSATLENSYSYERTSANSLLYSVDDRNDAVNMWDDNRSKEDRPCIDLYLQRNFDKRHSLMLNVVGTYIHNKANRYYIENNDIDTLTNIYSDTRGNKYSVIMEAIYSAGLTKTGTLSFGLSGTQAYTDNEYAGNVVATTNMHDGYGRMFAEWKQKVGNKFNYSFGSYLSYVWIMQGDKNMYKTILYPKASASYSISDKSNIRLSVERSYSIPSLGDLSNVDQIIDSLQIRRGNPDLKVSHTWQGNLNYEWRSKLFTLNASLFYMNQRNPVMEETYIENNKFIRTNINQVSWQKVNPELQLQAGPFFDIVSFNIIGGMNYFDSHGINYRHYYTNWYYNASMTMQYKRLSATAEVKNHKNEFYGETCTYQESYTILNADYKFSNDLKVGLIVLNPFQDRNRYNLPTNNYNRYAPSRQSMHIKESAKMFAVTFVWNFSFGRKYEGVQKQLNNSDRDSGTMKNGK